MRAITEIPANTPRPIGKTEIFLPGRAKGSEAPEDSDAAAVPSAASVAVADGSVPRLSAAGGCSAGGGVA